MLRVTAHDLAGRIVRTLHDGPAADGASLAWDGRDADGRALPAGVYFVRGVAAGQSVTRRVLRVR